MVTSVTRAALALALLVLASGCGSTTEDPRDAAAVFESAVGAGDAETACRLLAAATLEELEQSSGRPCAEALPQEVADAGALEDTSRFGTMAQVRYADDVLFLTRGPDGWQVLAAGCRHDGPTYDCQVSGG